MIKLSNTAFIRMVAVCLGVFILFSCSKEKDMREEVIENLGEPDEKEMGGTGPYKYEHYLYLNKNIDRIYVFQKSASGCGSSGNWYVAYVYQASYYGYEVYDPPSIQHVPVVTAPVGKTIKITAEITDDEQVLSADLFYRVAGTPDSTAVTMTVANTVYTAEIPAGSVTTAGVEYFIEASDGDHLSKLPPKGYFTVTVTTNKAAARFSEPESTSRISAPSESPVTGDTIDPHSSLGP